MNEKTKSNNLLERIATFIVDKRKGIFLLFLVAVIYCMTSISKVKIDNDITDYLPANSETRQGLTLMDKEFVTFGSAKVMVSNITYEQAEKLSNDLKKINGVSSVEFDDGKDHYKSASALFDLTFDGEKDDAVSKIAMAKVKQTLSGYDTYLSSEVGKDDAASLAKEMQRDPDGRHDQLRHLHHQPVSERQEIGARGGGDQDCGERGVPDDHDFRDHFIRHGDPDRSAFVGPHHCVHRQLSGAGNHHFHSSCDRCAAADASVRQRAVEKTAFTLKANTQKKLHSGSVRLDGHIKGYVSGLINANVKGTLQGDLDAVFDSRQTQAEYLSEDESEQSAPEKDGE